MHLSNTTAIVTGGASGLGAATAMAIAAKGARVFAFDLPSALHTAPRAQGVTHLPVDVTDPAQVRTAVERASSDQPLRTVVNCAGVAPSARVVGREGVHDTDLFATVVRINLVGTFTVMALASEAIAKTGPDANGQRGIVVNTASIAAFDGQVGQVAYASSKAGVVGMTLPAARDLADHGIRVNAIAPGIVDTPMLSSFDETVRVGLSAGIPFPKRLAKPDEFARMVTMIIEHDYINGETVRMDGGLRMAPR